MKNNYFKKSLWPGVVLCSLILMACGLKITQVTLSSSEIKQGEEITVTARYERGGMEWGNNHGIYLLYAIRVPTDWTNVGELEGINNYSDGNTSYEFEESPAYTALAEFSFPKENYKWIGFQTKNTVDITAADDSDDNIITTLTLRSGNQPGNYHLDIISGCFNYDPSILLKDDGKVDINAAFGNNYNFSAAVTPKEYTDADGNTITMFQFSEYLVNSGTISQAELDTRRLALMDYSATVQGKTYPITPSDLGNPLNNEEIEHLQLKVTVTDIVNNEDTSSVNSIGDSAIDNLPVYNLKGEKVDNPMKPGIYIRNGKKFVVK